MGRLARSMCLPSRVHRGSVELAAIRPRAKLLRIQLRSKLPFAPCEHGRGNHSPAEMPQNVSSESSFGIRFLCSCRGDGLVGNGQYINGIVTCFIGNCVGRSSGVVVTRSRLERVEVH